MKTCTKCSFSGDEALFCKGSNLCRECNKKYQKENRDSINAKRRQNSGKTKEQKLAERNEAKTIKLKLDRVCICCNFTGNPDYFYGRKNRPAVLASKRNYYQNNKETLALSNKARYYNNKEKITKNRRESVPKNGVCKKCDVEKMLVKNRLVCRDCDRIQKNTSERKREKNRRDLDPVYKLRKRFSTEINRAIKNYGKNPDGKSGTSITKFLPYTMKSLVKHLENLFEPWMNWSNNNPYDINTWNDNDQSTWVWHIDHIVLQSDLPYTSMKDDNFKKCWALENIRPLSGKQNVLDGTNRVRHMKEIK
jgi:hypothetical protein